MQEGQALGRLRQGLSISGALGHVDHHDQRGASTGEVDGVRDDLDVAQLTVLETMPPRPVVELDGVARVDRERGHGFLEAWHVLHRPDVAEPHAQKLFP